MNTSGTKLAVVGPDGSTSAARSKAVQTALDKHKLKATELAGDEHAVALKEFLSGKGWLRGAQADRLSEQEAEMVAGRLVKRVGATVPLTGEKAAALRGALTQAFKRRFIGEPDKVERQTLDQWRETLRKAAAAHLDEAGVKVFEEALAKGTRPLDGEK